MGYEEVFLPLACAKARGREGLVRYNGARRDCNLASFLPGLGIARVQVPGVAEHRPPHIGLSTQFWQRNGGNGFSCAEFRAAQRAEANELWHPVKDRLCLLQHDVQRVDGVTREYMLC